MKGELAANAIGVPFAGTRRRIDRERHRKLAQLRAQGREPYPDVHLPLRTLAAEIYASHDPHLLNLGEHRTWRYLVAGRLIARRKHRHATFLDLRDRSGVIELCVKRDHLDDRQRSQLLSSDIGDIVSAEGTIYVTDNYTLTLSITSLQLLTKALRSPPTRNGLVSATVEAGYQQCELDLLANGQTRTLLNTRSSMTGAIRGWMAQNNFIEIEGPVLERSLGGAREIGLADASSVQASRRLVLRRSSRRYLRHCLMGGLEQVYELSKRVTYERGSQRACYEDTVLEWSVAYIDYKEAARQAEALIVHIAESIAPTMHVRRDEQSIDLSGPWQTTTVRESIIAHCGVDILASDCSTLAQHLPEGARDAYDSWEAIVSDLYAKFVEPKLIQPTIVSDFPLAGRALVRRHSVNERLSSDFRVVVGGIELASGNGELNDPQERWSRAQPMSAAHDDGTPTARHDEELHLLEYGLCPASSVELQVDRLVMLLTGSKVVRDVIPFPRPASGG